METHLSNWKTMWQEEKSNSVEPSALILQLKLIEKRNKIQRTKLLIITAVLILACSIGLSELLANKYYLLSFVLLIVGIMVKLVPLYNNKLDLHSSDTSYNNHQFIKILAKRMDYNVWHLSTYMLIIVAALNLAIIGLSQKGTFFNYELNDRNKIFFHLATVILFLVAYLSNKRNLDIDRRRTKNLMRDLEINN